MVCNTVDTELNVMGICSMIFIMARNRQLADFTSVDLRLDPHQWVYLREEIQVKGQHNPTVIKGIDYREHPRYIQIMEELRYRGAIFYEREDRTR